LPWLFPKSIRRTDCWCAISAYTDNNLHHPIGRNEPQALRHFEETERSCLLPHTDAWGNTPTLIAP
jgi:hypothetical protein